MTRIFSAIMSCLVFTPSMALFGCNGNASNKKDDDGTVQYFNGEVQPVDATCTSVRLTAYEADDSGWCEFSTSHSFLPQFVQDGLHLAIAEPWNGGSFEGESGEACGECWEISTVNGTKTIMVTNLCPIAGNPLCSGGHFHFDLSLEAGAAVGGGSLDEAAAKRVPCPIDGNIHVQINDSNEWGYLRFAIVNHTIPVRSVEIAPSAEGPWAAAERSGGAMHVRENGPTPDDSNSIYFRMTSAMGETVVSTAGIPYLQADGAAFDLGVQFKEHYQADSNCLFTPPPDIYADSWGGIEGVLWQPNPWGDDAWVKEVDSDCHSDSDHCLAVSLGPWNGAHFYYRQSFATSSFTGLRAWVKGDSNVNLTLAPSSDGERCAETTIVLRGNSWQQIDMDLATICADTENINGLTIAHGDGKSTFRLDDIAFY